MKKILFLFIFNLVFWSAKSQCDGTANSLDLVDITKVSNSNTADIVVTANASLSSYTSGIFGTLLIKTPASTTDLVLSGTSSTGLTYTATYLSEDAGEPAGYKYYYFASSLVINPSTLFLSGTPVTIGTITVTPNTNLGLSSIVMTDLFPPTLPDGAGAYIYYRAAIQVCNTMSFEDNLISPAANILLPIKLLTFDAKLVDNKDARLDWESASEVNASHYEIERSLDGTTWEYIGRENAKNNGVQRNEYTYTDKNLSFVRDGVDAFYYRLRLVDLDGSHSYSEIRSVHFTPTAKISVAPNPANDLLYIETVSPEGAPNYGTVSLYDNTGKLVLTKEISANGKNELNVSALPGAMYQVGVKIGTYQTHDKIIIVH